MITLQKQLIIVIMNIIIHIHIIIINIIMIIMINTTNTCLTGRAPRLVGLRKGGGLPRAVPLIVVLLGIVLICYYD